MTKPILALAAAVVALSLAALAGAGTFTVRSSLDGRKVLPHRIHWLALPSLPANRIGEVDFLVDGRLVWVEHKRPYTYGLDGNWLVTSWLRPGVHTFTVEAVTTSGDRVRDTVRARTLQPRQPPAALAGTWRRTVTQAEAGSGTPAGTWTLTVDASGWRVRDPYGGQSWVDVAYPSAGRLQARGGIWTSPVESRGGNGWCQDTNAPVDYRWSVSGTALTVTLVGIDRCGDTNAKQHFIWAGNWRRAHQA